MRFTDFINQSADVVWRAISEPDAIANWFPGVKSSETHGNVRTVRGGSDGNVGDVKDIIVTNDDQLRRFQYRIAEAEGHLATVDVLQIEHNITLVIYSVELGNDDLAEAWQPYIEGGVEGLKALSRSGSLEATTNNRNGVRKQTLAR